MTILQIHNYYQFKGGEDFVVLSEREMLEAKGHTVIELTANNHEIKKLFKSKTIFYRELKETFERHKIDIVHIHNVFQIIGPEIYHELIQYKVPIVQTLHNYRFLCPAGQYLDPNAKLCELCSNGRFYHSTLKGCYQNSRVKSLIMSVLVKKARELTQKNVTLFISLNEFTRNKFIEAGFDKEKFRIKPNFLLDDGKKNHLQQDFKSPFERFALFLGRISKEKGIETIIETYKKLKFNIVIAGEGEFEYVEKLKAECQFYPNIMFWGFANAEDKCNLLSKCDYLIVPSIWYETFGLVAIEAFKFKKPVIASKIGGLQSLIVDNFNGLLFKPGDHLDLFNKISEIEANEKYKLLGDNALIDYLANYTDDINYVNLINIYEEAILINENEKAKII
ncbi:glycosyltransferase [Flectobacillus roseus]